MKTGRNAETVFSLREVNSLPLYWIFGFIERNQKRTLYRIKFLAKTIELVCNSDHYKDRLFYFRL